jgi:hypothetical protein
MKNLKTIIPIIITMFCCNVFAANETTITLTNPTNKIRIDEAVVLKRSFIEEKIGQIPQGKWIIVESMQVIKIASQTDDLYNDGNWDELAFLANLEPNETLKLKLIITDLNNIPVYQTRAHAQLKVSRERNDKFVVVTEETRPIDHLPQSMPMLYQFEGPGWENDKIAFRSYFDSRNGKDVFGKLTTAMVLDSVGLPGKSYHELSGWGMDVLKVGKSLGAGTLAVLYHDTLFRLGQTTQANYKLIANGPVRAIFQFSYTGWILNSDTLNLIEQITIWGGKNYFTSSIELQGNDSKKYKLVSGITTLHLINDNYKPEFYKINDSYSGLVVNEILSENKDLLAMGILVNNNYFNKWAQSPEAGINDEVVKTAYIVFNGNKIEFQFYAGWEKSNEQFKTKKLLNTIMSNDAESQLYPIKIK